MYKGLSANRAGGNAFRRYVSGYVARYVSEVRSANPQATSHL